LNEMYMLGGGRHIQTFVEVGQHERADGLVGPWAVKSAALNTANGVYRYCGSLRGGKGYPWLGLAVLDRFLKTPDLTPLERYEGLALRAIALEKIDKLLGDSKAQEEPSVATQARWILRSTTRARIAGRLRPAILEAVAAWEALGPARMTVAKPYSTRSMAAEQKNMYELPDATRLQETSAQLDRIVRQRFPQSASQSRPGSAGRSQPRR